MSIVKKINNKDDEVLAQMALMIWCLKIWWRDMKPLHWNMVEPWLNWWKC